MCGIFGYVGTAPNTAETILEGLKGLEYRGYDSWGIAAKVESSKLKGKSSGRNTILIEKHVGKIGNATLNSQFSTLNSNLAIGHTRWATHGGVTQENAHPHLDCKKEIAVIHNGIIENYADIKKELLKKGHKFTSETDTEVFVHLVEEYLKKSGFATAVRDAFNRLTGLNAVVVMYAPSGEIIAAKNGSPMIIGKGKDGFYIASDASGIIPHTRELLFLRDNEMVILGKNFQLLTLPKGKVINPQFQTIDWKIEDVSKGKFEHFLLKEIHEQPRVIENIALNYDTQTKTLADLIEKARGTFMLGCGTASYAALAGVYIFSRIAKCHVNFSIGSEFKYLEDYLTSKSLVIPISQSGETIDVVEPIGHAKEKGAKIAAIVNVLGSTLYRQADYNVLLNAGPEKAVVGTKSFIAMISVLLLTAYTYVDKQDFCKKLLIEAAQDVTKILQKNSIKRIKALAQDLKDSQHLFVIGRGLSYATALEATLKIKETSYIHAEGFAGGELKHGVIALIEKGTPCITIAPNDETFHEIISNAQEIKARGGYIIGIGPKNSDTFDVFLPTADVSDATIIPQVVIAQLLGYYIALAKGITDPDKPRNLAKSVTVK